ncbi:Transcription initiation factor IIA small chain (TFIIA 13.5 kDa subunit) [Aspergillus flavus]|nr:Transcription initiation factor IIA small chain (TFIIA 13.5 kDa subunit) [Aspergillus flavus]
MSNAQAYYELYRGSSLGLSLTDTLDDLINDGRIEPQLAMKILSTFDRVITEVLADKVRARLTFKGHLDTYRFCDEVWTFLIKDVTFKLDNQTTVQADKVKITFMALLCIFVSLGSCFLDRRYDNVSIGLTGAWIS